MDLINQIIARAKADRQRIVLPEGTEERTLKAADRVIADAVADVILIGNSAEIMALAEKIGLSPRSVSFIENGKTYPAPETLAAICDVLKIEPYKLFLFHQEKNIFEIKKNT